MTIHTVGYISNPIMFWPNLHEINFVLENIFHIFPLRRLSGDLNPFIMICYIRCNFCFMEGYIIIHETNPTLSIIISCASHRCFTAEKRFIKKTSSWTWIVFVQNEILSYRLPARCISIYYYLCSQSFFIRKTDITHVIYQNIVEDSKKSLWLQIFLWSLYRLNK